MAPLVYTLKNDDLRSLSREVVDPLARAAAEIKRQDAHLTNYAEVMADGRYEHADELHTALDLVMQAKELLATFVRPRWVTQEDVDRFADEVACLDEHGHALKATVSFLHVSRTLSVSGSDAHDLADWVREVMAQAAAEAEAEAE